MEVAMRKFVAIPVVLALGAATALAAVPEPTGLTAALRASAAEEPAFMLSAEGIHVYECKLTAANAAAWHFVAPDATLYEGSRSAGVLKVPNLWESTSDRSSVSGTVSATQAAGENLPWALYRAQPLSPTGVFAGVTSIQRVNTSGGSAPATGCTPANAGAEARVRFTASYYFYKRRGAA